MFPPKTCFTKSPSDQASKERLPNQIILYHPDKTIIEGDIDHYEQTTKYKCTDLYIMGDSWYAILK